eukprot:gene10789-14486_t
MDLTSGELYFRYSKLNGNISPLTTISEDFSRLLWSEVDTKIASNTIKNEIQKRKLMHKINTAMLKKKIDGDLVALRLSMETNNIRKLSVISIENNRALNALQDLQNQYDCFMMKSVLQYYSILYEEMKVTRRRLHNEKLEKEIQIMQENSLKNIRLFACHLAVETKGQIGFTLLSNESPQANRCNKAVLDNVLQSFSSEVDDLQSKIKVLNVFKLQNSFLASNLQAASEQLVNSKSTKIKGLFCCIPTRFFYNFSVFGLYAQHLNGVADCMLDQLSPNLFHKPWFYYELPDHLSFNVHQYKEISQLLSVAGSASRLATQRDGYLNLRFSRYSTISTLKDYSAEDIQSGVCLALCRVLISKQMTIQKPIDDEDIIQALSLNYDTLYSTTSEEYVLLQPKFVLPEFIMHTQFPMEISTKFDQSESINNVSFNGYFHNVMKLEFNNNHKFEEDSSDSLANLLAQYFVKSNENQKVFNTKSNHNPRQALIQKQNIVLKMEESVANFKLEKLKILKDWHAKLYAHHC